MSMRAYALSGNVRDDQEVGSAYLGIFNPYELVAFDAEYPVDKKPWTCTKEIVVSDYGAQIVAGCLASHRKPSDCGVQHARPGAKLSKESWLFRPLPIWDSTESFNDDEGNLNTDLMEGRLPDEYYLGVLGSERLTKERGAAYKKYCDRSPIHGNNTTPDEMSILPMMYSTLKGRVSLMPDNTPINEMSDQDCKCAHPSCKRVRQYEIGCDWDKCCELCHKHDGTKHTPACDAKHGSTAKAEDRSPLPRRTRGMQPPLYAGRRKLLRGVWGRTLPELRGMYCN